METCIAVDIGGTKMLVAEVRADGTIVHTKRYATGHSNKEEIVRMLVSGIREYESEIGWENGKRPKQIGIGINGIVDPIKGVWKKIKPDEMEIALVEYIEKEFEIKCYIDNDVKATAIAENKFGVGKGCQDMVYINIGTGLAAGMIANGKLIRGTDGFAGEIGFMNFTGGQGARVELLVSGTGIRYQAEQLIQQFPNSLLKEKEINLISGQDIYLAADKGDELAQHILNEMIKMGGLMISNLTCVLSPEMVVLGGGLIENTSILQKIEAAVSLKARQHLEKGVTLTGLNPAYAGLIGAAAIGFGYQEEFF